VEGALPERLRNLLTPAAYPHPVEAVELVQTHVSWVLLTGTYAYKIKRPVRYEFIDLRSMDQRAFFCNEELRLNRRFAADLYVDVCKVTSQADVVRIDGPGVVIDHAVRMRQFRREDELDRLLESDDIEPPELYRFGRSLAEIHERLPVASADSGHGTPETVRSLILGNLEQCIRAQTSPRLRARLYELRPVVAQRLTLVASSIARRVTTGRVRECHGDLHSRNVVRRDGDLLAFDCMEFDPALRWIDVADEIAFLLMDLEALRRPAHAHAFLTGYLAQSGDYEALRVLDLYKAHRALVRAKVTALAATGLPDAVDNDDRTTTQCESYVDGACASLAVARPQLYLMSGVSGSGKTWLATRLAPRLRAVHLRSDDERQRPRVRVPPSGAHDAGVAVGRYAPEARASVYEHLAQCAEDALRGGYPVIVDATFGRRQDRRRFHDLAASLGLTARVIHCQAEPGVLRARISGRLAQGTDASEADVAVLQWQEAHEEPLLESEGFAVTQVEMTDDEPSPSIDELVSSLPVRVLQGVGTRETT
jgi:aminoglycoside phosphotransferase family enzyme/predicted kinase